MNSCKIDPLTILFLKQGNVEVGLLPELGGSIAFAKYNQIDFMRPWNGELTPRRTCCYPLVPFSNRIANGRFRFAGHSYQLAKNFGEHPHTIHGVGWQRCWQLIESDDKQATLFFEHIPASEDEWPFAFAVTQQFIVSETGLFVRMTIENRADCTVPVGFGWHPFFPRHDSVLLQFDAEKVVLNSETMLPEKIANIPQDWDFSQSKPLGEPSLDNCFINWQRSAAIVWPGKHLALSITASELLQHLVVMTPAAPLNHFFAVEPVSHINNAINSAKPQKEGIGLLAKGQTLSGWMQLHVSEI